MKSLLAPLRRKPDQRHAVNDLPPASRGLEGFFLGEGYRPRLTPEYFDDFVPGTRQLLHQPDIYSLAGCLASLGARRIIDIGCGKGEKLQSLAGTFHVVGVDVGPNIEHCRRTYAFGRWITHDLDANTELPLSAADLQDSIIICADVIEHLVDPSPLLRNLKTCVDLGACLLLSTPERHLARGHSDQGPPANPAHVREWTIGELRALLLHFGFEIPFLGLTANNSVDRKMSTIIAVLRSGTRGLAPNA